MTAVMPTTRYLILTTGVFETTPSLLSPITIFVGLFFAIRNVALRVIAGGHTACFETIVARTEISTGNSKPLERDADVNETLCCDQRMKLVACISAGIDPRGDGR